MGGYPNFCGIYMFDDFNKCADLPPLSRNQQKALKRKNKQINMSNDQNMSPQHSTKKFTAHFIQLNMHKSEVVAERLRQFVIRFNTSAQQDDTPLICLLQEPPYSGTRLILHLITMKSA